MADLGEYHEEINYSLVNAREIAKALEKKEQTVEVSAAFSKRPENAAEFRPVQAILKKKRTIEQMTTAPLDDGTSQAADANGK